MTSSSSATPSPVPEPTKPATAFWSLAGDLTGTVLDAADPAAGVEVTGAESLTPCLLPARSPAVPGTGLACEELDVDAAAAEAEVEAPAEENSERPMNGLAPWLPAVADPELEEAMKPFPPLSGTEPNSKAVEVEADAGADAGADADAEAEAEAVGKKLEEKPAAAAAAKSPMPAAGAGEESDTPAKGFEEASKTGSSLGLRRPGTS
mmetsp:Transcript_1651/g.3892  ORF Transcript_1651/g.3892 Transcript_1651/m.3892 type:complete len:207 (-) Transcript_1651:25-645(-)